LSEEKKHISEIVEDMAKLTILSNRINQVQEKNLKMFPFIFFEGIKAVKIDYDLSRTKPEKDEHEKCTSRVSYFLTLDEKANEPNKEKRFVATEGAIRQLFWSDVEVEVYFNDILVFKSVKNDRQ